MTGLNVTAVNIHIQGMVFENDVPNEQADDTEEEGGI